MSELSEPQLFTLPQRYLDLAARARELAASVTHLAATADEGSSLDEGMRDALRASGLAALTVPAEFGGETEKVDSLAITVVREALMGTSGHLDSLFAMQGIGSFALSVGASPEVKAHWLPKVATLHAIAALGLTEPHIGSDLKNITSTIEVDCEHLVVNGAKAYITNAGAADFYTVLGKEGDGYSLALVPTDTPGVMVKSGPDLIAPHIIGEVTFDNARVPLNHRVGLPGKGFNLVLATLGTFRVSVAGAAVGLAQAALDEALRHCTGRLQFGAPLTSIGAVSQKLALCWSEIEMTRTFVHRAAAAAAVDPRGSLDLASMAKVNATEMVGRVVDSCVQVMGRFGIVTGSLMERYYREARPMRIYEGATEVLLDSLARQLVKGANK